MYFLFMDAEENTRISEKCFLHSKKRYRSWNGSCNHQRQKNPNEVVEMPERNLCSKGGVLAERNTINYYIKWYRGGKWCKAVKC